MCREAAAGVPVGTVENMDVFYEPTWTYSRRVPEGTPADASPQ
jgi:hypothetical protein